MNGLFVSLIFNREELLKFLPVILSLAFITNASYADPFDSKPASGQVEIPNIGNGIGLLDQQKKNLSVKKFSVKCINKCQSYRMYG